MTWALFIFVFGSGIPALSTVSGFRSEIGCEAAAIKIKARLYPDGARTECIELK